MTFHKDDFPFLAQPLDLLRQEEGRPVSPVLSEAARQVPAKNPVCRLTERVVAVPGNFGNVQRGRLAGRRFQSI